MSPTIKILIAAQALMGKLASALAHASPDRYTPSMRWNKPSGEHAVGQMDWGYSIDDQKLMMRVWYPATAATERAQYLSEEELVAMTEGMGRALTFTPYLVGRLADGISWSQRDAEAKHFDQALPLLIFSHGFAGTVNQNTALAEELVSHGYIVMSIAHPSGAAAVHYPDGSNKAMSPEEKLKSLNPELIKAAMAIKKSKNLAARRQAILDYCEIEPMHGEAKHWQGNISHTLDLLLAEKEVAEHPLAAIFKAIDWSKIATFGHSFGGAASMAAAHSDQRICAAANLDGGQFGLELFDTDLNVPALMLYSDTASFENGAAFNDFHYEKSATAGTQGKVKRYFFRGTGHLDFTDMTLFGRHFVKRMLGRGKNDGQRMLDATASMVLAFFNQQLKAQDDTLSEVAGQYNNIEAQDMQAVRDMGQ